MAASANEQQYQRLGTGMVTRRPFHSLSLPHWQRSGHLHHECRWRSNSRLLYNSPNYDWGADWTADGSSIIFTQDEADTAVIYMMNADGSNVRKITERGSYPSWVK